MSYDYPDNTDDVIDSRQVTARIEELEGDPYLTENPELEGELAVLLSLKEQAESAPDWSHGETLIRDSYFVDYARQLAEDIGAIDSNTSWPLYCIDWERAARDLQKDYTSVDFDGVTYWIRS